LPTAPFFVLEPGDSLPSIPWACPSIVKPDSQDASLGLGENSVVADPSRVGERVEQVRQSHGPRVLVEQYLPGPEYNVGVLALPEPAALPVAEVVYRDQAGTWPILTYAAKWAIGSDEDLASPVRCPAHLSPELEDRLAGLAVSAFTLTGCRDYARVDFRLDSLGKPMILEVNPNPDLDPSAGLARAMAVAGRNYAETLAQLVKQAVDRGSRRE
jgi:D-alanine-D-alanine ligase